MMIKHTKYLVILLSLLFIACNIEPQPINYGDDVCHYCSMTIVDKQHAAQLVTDKGKAFKFDATECMINHLKDIDTSTVALYITSDYSDPESLIDAEKATFIISENIPSPMGAFLSATRTKEQALAMQDEKGGQLYNWKELLNHLNQ